MRAACETHKACGFQAFVRLVEGPDRIEPAELWLTMWVITGSAMGEHEHLQHAEILGQRVKLWRRFFQKEGPGVALDFNKPQL